MYISKIFHFVIPANSLAVVITFVGSAFVCKVASNDDAFGTSEVFSFALNACLVTCGRRINFHNSYSVL